MNKTELIHNLGTTNSSITRILETQDDTNSGNVLKIVEKTKPLRTWQIQLGGKYFHQEDEDSWIDFWLRILPEYYVYSAFWDDRSSISSKGPIIRIFGKVRLNVVNVSSIQCALQFGETAGSDILVQPLQGHYRFSLKCYDGGSIEFRCSVPPGQKPTSVSLVLNDRWKPWHWVSIHYPKKMNSENKIVLCTTPMYGDFSNHILIIELIAYYKTVGVTHFVFYDAGCSDTVRKTLKKLNLAGISLDVLPFVKHGEKDNRKWNERAQVISVQDCMYRHMHTYEYGLYVDLDEFIFPVQHETLQELLKSEEQRIPGNCCGEYVFRHFLYCLDYPSFPVPYLPFEFNTLLKRYVVNNTQGYDRSRYITKIAELEHHGCVHRVAHLLPGSKRHLVPDQVGFSHHYRRGVKYDNRIDCGNFGNAKMKNIVIYDPSLPFKFGNKMIKLVKLWKMFYGIE
ncbi:uncharacterized protein LOC106463370 [Limulus polyphemus]|uniref:Glycosyltransferase family 92 protein n=1 Tax=Limulus polyphemus TaxID=6850 RepID=A0ABM1BBU7_LIMPO|nr:uncharacterized protein LOC106463370 [Limulus polyphemus]